jgi:hypothetical protein
MNFRIIHGSDVIPTGFDTKIVCKQQQPHASYNKIYGNLSILEDFLLLLIGSCDTDDSRRFYRRVKPA